MKSDVHVAIAVLESELTDIDGQIERLQGDRRSVVESISRLRSKNGRPKEVVANPRKTRAAISSQEDPRKGFRKNAKGQASLTALVAEAGQAQNENFNVGDLGSYLAKHHPRRMVGVTNKDLAKQVYLLRKRSRFDLVAEDREGGMNTYRNNPKNR